MKVEVESEVKDCETAETGDTRISEFRPDAVEAKCDRLKGCDCRREVGEYEIEETEGDLKQSSRNSVLIALTGVIGEAIDLEVTGLLR